MANPSTPKGLSGFFSNFFRIQASPQGVAVPAKRDPKDGKSKAFSKLPPQIYRIWDWWFQENYNDKASSASRKARYNELDFMVRNDPMIASALNLYADEIVQSDTPNGVLTVNAKNSKISNTITEILRSWGMTQEKLRVIAYDMMKYGDSFTVKGIDPQRGIISQTILDPYDIYDRMEFNATRFDATRYGQLDTLSRPAKLQKIADFLKGTSADLLEVSEFFQSYLFGFTMFNGLVLPPWMISHFRIQTTQKEIWPFGQSDFSYSVPTFRQLVASKNLQGVARVLSMPLETYGVATHEEMPADEVWEALQDVKAEIENAGKLSQNRDDMGLNNRLFYPKDLVEFELKDRNHDLDKIADIEYLRDDLIMSTLIPKGYLIVDKASFGASGTSLLQQYKPFGRRVFARQSIIMKELAQDIRIHLEITNQLDGANTEFELEMNFPQIEESRDRIQQKGDTFRLAKDVTDGLKDLVGADSLPPEIIKQIFGQLSFLNPKEIESWIDASVKHKEALDAQAPKEDDPFAEKADRSRRKTEAVARHNLFEKCQAVLTEDAVREVFFESKKRLGVGEGVVGSKHFVASWNSTDEVGLFNTLKEFVKSDRNKLREVKRAFKGKKEFG